MLSFVVVDGGHTGVSNNNTTSMDMALAHTYTQIRRLLIFIL